MTTYYGIEDGEEFRPWLWEAPNNNIGKTELVRRDGFPKASGKAIYGRDFKIQGMFSAKAMESPYAHARIVSMDTTRAAAMPGVRKIIKWDDPPVAYGGYDNQRYPGYLPILPTEVWFAGQLCGAIIVADSELACDEALRVLMQDTEWEKLPFYLDWEEALEPGAALIYPEQTESNLQMEHVEDHGDVDAALKAATNTIEVTMKNNPTTFACPEGASDTIKYRSDNELEGWLNHQYPITCQMYDPYIHTWIKPGGFNFRTLYVGGGFGHMFERIHNHFLAARAAKDFNGRPVNERHDGSFYWLGEEFGTYKWNIGYEDNGEVTAVKVDTIAACQQLDQVNKILKSGKVENVRCTKSYPYQNLGGYSCFKHGGPHVVIQNEVYAQVAAALEMDPTEVALINDGCHGHSMEWIDENVKKVYGFPDRDSLKECIEVGKEAIGWDDKWHQPGTKILENGNYHGIGFLWVNAWNHVPDETNMSDPGDQIDTEHFYEGRTGPLGIKMEGNGQAWVLGYDVIIGTNRDTPYAAIVADEIGMKLEDVEIEATQLPRYTNHFRFYNPGGSRGMTYNTPALVRIAKMMKKMILEAAVNPMNTSGSELGGGVHIPMATLPPLFPDKTIDELDIKDSEIFEKANPENKFPISAVTQNISRDMFVWGTAPRLTDTMDAYSYNMGRQCYFMEVEVDPDTGKVEVNNLVVVNDVGKAISPETLNGQQRGGSYMGFGRSCTEEIIYDPIEGVKLNDNLVGYGVALMDDIKAIDCHLVETGLGWSAYGLFGIGESGCACTIGLARYAVHNAIGKWVDLKVTPDKILKALGKA